MIRQHMARQRGISLIGLICALIVVAFVAMLGMKVVPEVIEYRAISRAIVDAKQSGTTVLEIQKSFNRRAEVGYIESITGQDLEITKGDNGFEVSFAYEKKIPLFGPASLLLEFSGTTERNPARKAPTQGK